MSEVRTRRGQRSTTWMFILLLFNFSHALMQHLDQHQRKAKSYLFLSAKFFKSFASTTGYQQWPLLLKKGSGMLSVGVESRVVLVTECWLNNTGLFICDLELEPFDRVVLLNSSTLMALFCVFFSGFHKVLKERGVTTQTVKVGHSHPHLTL